MNTFDNFTDEDLQQLLGFQLPEEQQAFKGFQAQPPQMVQGLLGDVGAEQEQKLQNLVGRGVQQSGAMAQAAQPAIGSNQNAQMAQAGMQNAMRQPSSEAQAGAMLGKLARMFLMGG